MKHIEFKASRHEHTKHRANLATIAAAPLLALTMTGCSEGRLEVNFVSAAAASLQAETGPSSGPQGAGPLEFPDALKAGTETVVTSLPTGMAEGLVSYKVYFREIRLCESLVTNGTAYSDTMGCTELYENTSDPYDWQKTPTEADVNAFRAAGSGNTTTSCRSPTWPR
ncbi:MAG: hypothetical protein FJ096_15880 [Deltaproteobacteria bacterium]|nr:hypothetical protein [Deltaproteobacteria bacterium]